MILINPSVDLQKSYGKQLSPQILQYQSNRYLLRGETTTKPKTIHSCTVSDVPVTSKMVKRKKVHCFNNGLHCVVRTRTLAYSSIKTPCYTVSFFIRIQLFHLRNRGPNKLTYSEVGWFTWPSKGFVQNPAKLAITHQEEHFFPFSKVYFTWIGSEGLRVKIVHMNTPTSVIRKDGSGSAFFVSILISKVNLPSIFRKLQSNRESDRA